MKEASQADPSIVVQPPARPPRHQKWKVARMKGDKYVNADVAEVASKTDALEQQSSQGSFTPATRMDILSMAIGKPDYLDACRGEPRGVSVAKFFGERSRGKPNEDIKAMFAGGRRRIDDFFGAKEQGGPKWYYPKCPQQTECGYYVIHHMHAIVSTRRLTGFLNFFDSSVAPFSDEEVDTIRDVMARHLLQYV
ncbi:hypothetical protein K1719_010123 [Acacia pycnantha]|nr:hypothetical protein K1719_010123 [Acacia pycnantha]